MTWQSPYHSSKFRHVFAKPASRENCYSGLPITSSVHDNAFCAVNPRFIAVVTECAGGGAFLVISVYHKGRVDPQHSRVCGHQGSVLDVRWDPFSDLRIASCSEDCTVKVWSIPPQGLRENLVRPVKDLRGHSRRVGLIEWHPVAKDILLSSAYDCKVFIWSLDVPGCVCRRPVRVIAVHSDLVLCLSFNTDGSQLATTCKDRTIRIVHTHSGQVLQRSSAGSHRPCKVVFASDLRLLITTGASYWNQRQIAVWNSEDLSTPLWEEDLDGESGVLFPFYDPDTHMVFLAGKGDGNTRIFDLSSAKPYLHYLAEYRSPLPQRSMAVMPKRGLDVSVCEVFRFYRLVGVKDRLEPISFIIPRRADGFQEDLYPPTAANEPALTAAQWVEGHTRGPLLMSLRPGTEIQNPYPAPDAAPSPLPLPHFQPMGVHFPDPPANHNASSPYLYDISDLSDWQEDGTHTLNMMQQTTAIQPTHTLDWGAPHTTHAVNTHTLIGGQMLAAVPNTHLAHTPMPGVQPAQTAVMHSGATTGHTHAALTQTPPAGVNGFNVSSSSSSHHALPRPHTPCGGMPAMGMPATAQGRAGPTVALPPPPPPPSPLVWCESPVYTPPRTDDELLFEFYRQCEELKSLRQELHRRDMLISQLEQDITHLRSTHTHLDHALATLNTHPPPTHTPYTRPPLTHTPYTTHPMVAPPQHNATPPTQQQQQQHTQPAQAHMTPQNTHHPQLTHTRTLQNANTHTAQPLAPTIPYATHPIVQHNTTMTPPVQNALPQAHTPGVYFSTQRVQFLEQDTVVPTQVVAATPVQIVRSPLNSPRTSC